MRSSIFLATLAFGLSAPTATSAKQDHSSPTVQTIVIYVGDVDAKSASRLTDLIAQNTDKVIGLKISVHKSHNTEETYNSSLTDDGLFIESGDPIESPVDVLITEDVGTTAAGEVFTVDGFYLIKSVSSDAAGAHSYAAIQVSEADIRHNPEIRIVTKPI